MKTKFKYVFFHPWIGKNYKNGIKNKKILIIGESHICGGCKEQCGDLNIEDKECREMTTIAVRHFLDYKQGKVDFKHWMNTYTRFSNVFQNKKLSEDEMFEFWNNISFYNYVQFATNEARISPSSDEFTNSENAFLEILDELKPDLVIAWGDRLWSNMPLGGQYKKSESSKINWGKGLYYYKLENTEIPVMCTYHPSSSAFNYGWYEIIQEALSEI